MSSPRRETQEIQELEITLYVKIEKGPDTYAAWSEAETISLTSLDLYAIAEKNKERYQKAWTELAEA